MFCAMKAMLAGLAARLREPQRAAMREQQRVLLALARQAQAAATVRQLAQVLLLGRLSLPARQQAVLQQAVQVRLVQLPLLIPTRGSPKSTGSRSKTARSTSRRRRAR